MSQIFPDFSTFNKKTAFRIEKLMLLRCRAYSFDSPQQQHAGQRCSKFKRRQRRLRSSQSRLPANNGSFFGARNCAEVNDFF